MKTGRLAVIGSVLPTAVGYGDRGGLESVVRQVPPPPTAQDLIGAYEQMIARAIDRRCDINATSIGDLMSTGAKSVHTDTLAAEALR